MSRVTLFRSTPLQLFPREEGNAHAPHISQKRVFSTSRSRSARRHEKLAREARLAAVAERTARDEKYRQARELLAPQNGGLPGGGRLTNLPPGPNASGVDDKTRIALFNELSVLLEKTQRFDQFFEERVWNGAFFLVKYRIYTLDILRRASAQARRYFFEDLREKGALAFGEISFLVALRHHVKPNEQAASVKEKDVRLTLVDIPKALESFQPWLSDISGIIHPGQDMVDWIIANSIDVSSIL